MGEYARSINPSLAVFEARIEQGSWLLCSPGFSSVCDFCCENLRAMQKRECIRSKSEPNGRFNS